jgi:hypothetical protein
MVYKLLECAYGINKIGKKKYEGSVHEYEF